MVCPVRPASLLLGVGLVLLSPVECSRARRKHHPAPATYANSGDKPSLVTPQQGLIREESSIPGVSIWTSRRAAAASASARRRRASSSSADPSSNASSYCYSNAEPAGFAGECQQDGRGGIGDADVEPPSRGAREEARDDLGEDEYEGVLTTEEEEDEHANEDAPPGRLLEEGGGSDSQEDDTDDSEDHSEDGHDDDDDEDGDDSYDDGSYESHEEEMEASLVGDEVRSGRSGGVAGSSMSRDSSEARSRRGRGRGVGEVSALANKYEDDEEACFTRVKELWHDRVLLPLSQAEVAELSEGVRADQKKLMEAAPTEWNSGPGRMAKEAALAAAKKGAGRPRDSGEDEMAQPTAANDRQGGDGEAGSGVVVDDESSLGLLYRLLLAEMQGNGSSGGLNNRWIDRDALLQLRGAATLAHHPKYLRHTANLPRVTRGVRLVAPEATHSMQEALARSLGHSTSSRLLFLDSKAIEAVRGQALAEGIPKEHLTSRQLASALLELAGEDDSPYLVFLMDKGSAVLKSRGMCQRLTEELKNESSRVLFLLSTASDPSLPGNPPAGPGDDASSQDDPQQGGGGIFGPPLQWPPQTHGMSPGQSKRSDGSPKKNYIFLHQNQPGGGAPDGSGGGGGGGGGSFFGGRPNRGGRGGGGGGRSGGRGQPQPGQQGFGEGGGGGRRGGGPGGPPIPPQMLEQMLREAMKNMRSGDTGKGDGAGRNGSGGEVGNGSGEIPPGLMEALGEALNDDEFKRTLEQIGKQLGKDQGQQGFSIMFSASTTPLNGGDGNNNGGDGSDNGNNNASAGESGSDGNASHSWGGGGSRGPGDDRGGSGGNNWQSSSSLSWLTNLRKGIMSGDEMGNGVEGNDDYGMENQDGSGAGPNTGGGGSGSAGAGGDGGGGGGGGGRSKADTRRGVDLPPSGTEIRAFVNLFEDIAVNPPQDAVLRQHWDTWVKEDVGKHNAQQNRQEVGHRPTLHMVVGAVSALLSSWTKLSEYRMKRASFRCGG
ncbi:unnamed protein product, partial [Ectocarpus sp. 4 AP-2014]